MKKKDKGDCIVVKCSKEQELTKLQTDMEWVKKACENMIPKIDDMHTTFLKGEGKIGVLNKEVFGNGKKGLRDSVNDLKVRLAYYSGIIAVVTVIGTAIVNQIIN